MDCAETSRARAQRAAALLAAVGALLCHLGCAGHAASTLGARNALDANQPHKAIELLNEQLEVEDERRDVDDVAGENVLYLLDRAAVLQQVNEYALSSRDLQICDKQIEVLDFSRGTADEIGRYLFSDDVGPYKAPAYEKLLINTLNMVNYLVRGDLNGARVEARRFAVMHKFISEREGEGGALSGPGSYLAGFVFEKSGKPDEALRFYDEALQSIAYQSLHEPIRRLAAQSGYRTPRLSEIVGPAPRLGAGQVQGATAEDSGGAQQMEAQAQSGQPGAAEPQQPAVQQPEAARAKPPAEVLVVVAYGRVPAKIARRIPIGLALTLVAGHISPSDRSRAAYLAGQGLVTWVNYPELGEPKGEYGLPMVSVDGQSVALDRAFAVDVEARKAWDEGKTALVLSAITRMIARAAVGEGTRRVAGGGVLGALLSLGTQAALTAADTPDTRSWSTLPARIALARMRLAPGRHRVQLSVRGVNKTQQIEVKPGGWAVVNLTALR